MKTKKVKVADKNLPVEVFKSDGLLIQEKSFLNEIGKYPDWKIEGPFDDVNKFSAEIMNVDKPSKRFGFDEDSAKVNSLAFFFKQLLDE